MMRKRIYTTKGGYMININHYIRVQKERIAYELRAAKLAENGAPKDEVEFWLSIASKLSDEEDRLEKEIKRYAEQHPLYQAFVSRVKGIGPQLFGKIILRLDHIGIHNFKYPSSLWRWCGLAVKDGIAQNRLTGKDAQEWKFDRDIRRFLYQLGECFVKVGGYYREHYDRFKAQSLLKHPDWNPGHHHNHAMRLTVKLFLAHLWEEARKLHGLPVHQPFAIDKLGHTTYYSPKLEKPERKRCVY